METRTAESSFFDASSSGNYLAANDPRIIVGLGGAASSNKSKPLDGKVQLLENPAIQPLSFG